MSLCLIILQVRLTSLSMMTSTETCGICQTALLVLVDEEEHHLALDSPATARVALGVVRVGECGHHFCRRDASKWLTKVRRHVLKTNASASAEWIVLLQSNACPLCRSPCDPSRQQPTADGSAATDSPADAPPTTFGGAPGRGQTPEQMMEMLQAMFGIAPGGQPNATAAREREAAEREDFSGMYS